MKIAIVYDRLADIDYAALGSPRATSEYGCEFESSETISTLQKTIADLGHSPYRLPFNSETARALALDPPDLAFNLAEGVVGPERESLVPNLCQCLGIPHTGSGGGALFYTLDKDLTRKLALELGIPVAKGVRVENQAGLSACQVLCYPLFVKPNGEGTSMGISQQSLVLDQTALASRASTLLRNYHGPILVEEFLPGREFTVALLNQNGQLSALGSAEIKSSEQGIYCQQFKGKSGLTEKVIAPAIMDAQLQNAMEAQALELALKIGVRSYARVDFKCDAAGTPHLLEINPLPGISPIYSTFPIIAATVGISYPALIGQIISLASSTPELNTARAWQPPQESWKDQLRHQVTDLTELRKYLAIPHSAQTGIIAAGARYRWAITPYWLSLMAKNDPSCPIRIQAIPDPRELCDPPGMADPLAEAIAPPAPGMIRMYPDRVAWCVTNRCAVLCRHCLRKRCFGKQDQTLTPKELALGLDYIASNPQIRDVLLTGGDAFLLSDDQIDSLLCALRKIAHVQIIRLGTRTLSTLPMRVTPKLCRILRAHHPVWVNTQFNSHHEVTPEAAKAVDLLLLAGVPVGNQSVLLRGVNDTVAKHRSLTEALLKIRVRPYYLFLAQLVEGTAHLRTTMETGLEIISGLRGHTSGLAIPQFVLDTPSGKIPLAPNNIVERTATSVTLQHWQGGTWTEPNPAPENFQKVDK